MKRNIFFALLLIILLGSITFSNTLVFSALNKMNKVELTKHKAELKKKTNPYKDDNYWDDPLLEENIIVSTAVISKYSSQRLISQLLYLESKKPGKTITLVLKSSGGSSGDCMAIINAMRMISAPVNVVALGRTSSAGAFILAAATGKSMIMEDVIIGIHMVFREYNPDDHAYDSAAKVANYIRGFWAETANLPELFFPKEGEKLDKSFYLDAEQALAYGVVDQIVDANSKEIMSLFHK